MSDSTRNPMRVIGGILDSGFVQTGEQRTTNGGEATYSAMSGVNVATVIFSGAGRLNRSLVTAQLVSGQAIQLIDAEPIATSGMPLLNSGHKMIGLIAPIWRVGASGALTLSSQEGLWNDIQVPFFSGLLACPLASGTPGFSLSYTPSRSGY